MTGWGRTGTLFACEQADVTPDIACYSKGLTGGSLPLAVTLCHAGIGPKLQAFFFGARNLLLRPLGNTIYVMPPYCVTTADLGEIYAAIQDAASI